MICWFHHSLGSGPWCYPFAVAIVLEVCTLSCTLVIYMSDRRASSWMRVSEFYCLACRSAEVLGKWLDEMTQSVVHEMDRVWQEQVVKLGQNELSKWRNRDLA